MGHGHRFREEPKEAVGTVSSKWVSSGDWTDKRGVCARWRRIQFEGLVERIFLLNSGQAPDPGRQGEQKHSETCQGAMLQEKSGGARDSAAWKKPEAV
jgi:hypothetical protein